MAVVVGQPLPSYSYKYAEVAPPQLYVSDPLFVAKMQNIIHYDMRQTAAVLRAATANIWPNHYILSDRDIQVPVVGHKDNVKVSNPVFALEEESSCCCRLCCRGNQPFLARLYHITGVQAGKTVCGCCYTGHQYTLDYTKPIMTFEREGCCSKWLGCCVCANLCRNDLYMHVGEFNGPIGTTKPDGAYFGSSSIPHGGGGLTPTVELTNKGRPGNGGPFAFIEGPCVFAGWKALCCGDTFTVSSSKGRSGDLGKIEKKRPDGACSLCLRLFASGASNQYNLDFSPQYQSLSAEDKAVVLGGLLHTNYIIYQNDVPPIMVRSTDDGKGVCIICTLWECWLSGCILPCQVCIVLHSN